MKKYIKAQLFGIAISILLAFLSSIVWSKVYWGYYFRPPRIDARIASFAKVVSISKFWRWNYEKEERYFPEMDLAWIHNNVTPPSFSECPQNRILYALHEADLLPLKARCLPEDDVREIVTRIDVDTDFLWGLLVVAEDHSGSTNIFFSGATFPADHRSYCELLARQDARGGLDRISYKTFNFDTAGIEGTTWLVVFRLLTIVILPAVFLLVSLVFAIGIMIQKTKDDEMKVVKRIGIVFYLLGAAGSVTFPVLTNLIDYRTNFPLGMWASIALCAAGFTCLVWSLIAERKRK